MTTAEMTTITMINSLSDNELFHIEKKVQEAAETRRREKVLKPMNRKEIVAYLNESYEQSLRDESVSAEAAREEVRAKYGI